MKSNYTLAAFSFKWITIFTHALIHSSRYPKTLTNLVKLILYRALQR